MAPPMPPTKEPRPSVPGMPKTLSLQTLQTPEAMENLERWKLHWMTGSPPSTVMAPAVCAAGCLRF